MKTEGKENKTGSEGENWKRKEKCSDEFENKNKRTSKGYKHGKERKKGEKSKQRWSMKKKWNDENR